MAWYSHVVVGYDGLREGERALRWSVDEARRRRIGLTVCHAWSWPYLEREVDPSAKRVIRTLAERVLEHGVGLASGLAPRTAVTGRLVEGPVASVLLHESARAELVVLGANGHDEMPLGATASRVAARAPCPVIVVRDVGPGDGRIVVGYADAVSCSRVLAFGFAEAALQGWRVHLVHGYGAERAPPGAGSGGRADMAELGRAAGARLERLIAPHRARHPNVDARISITPEPPRRALAGAAAGAQMLAMGDRVAEGDPPLLLGSTSQAMLLYAPCPVAIVHRNGDSLTRVRPPHPGEAATGVVVGSPHGEGHLT
ncbi:universal stress protein [Actinomadura sp. NTSP31]|uniref:universal stress protein n=1 Tax=Actinomadura sp. NTSP31 TaxID=1735447 RepID=UPI0035C002EC